LNYRILGKSDLEISTVSFGAWAVGGWAWGGADDDAAMRAIQASVEAGVNCIDTAPMYGMGHSESVVGRAIADRRGQVVVATKCGLRWDREEGQYAFESQKTDGSPVRIYRNLKPESIREECDQSLKRLGIDRIDLYQCHWPDASTPIADTMAVLLELQTQGKIRHIGVSNFAPALMKDLLRQGAFISDQLLYNPLQRGAEINDLPFCREHGLGVLTYSTLAQGLLTGKVSTEREFPKGDIRRNHPLFTTPNRKKVRALLDKIEPLAKERGITLAQLAIAWVIAQEGVTTAIVGARNELQAKENASAGVVELTQEEMDEMRQCLEETELET
jgi:aryl-alcohol dehydrogenase-like predicted oxidoreductase